MEGTHGKLGPWLTDSLCRDRTNRFPEADNLIPSEVKSVTVLTDAHGAFTSEWRADKNFIHSRFLHFERIKLGEKMPFLEDNHSFIVSNIAREKAAANAL